MSEFLTEFSKSVTPALIELLTMTVLILISLATRKMSKFLSENADNQQLARLYNIIHKAVNSAEQIFGDQTGAEKYEYVRNIIANAPESLGYSDEELEAFIESSVRDIKDIDKYGGDK